MVKGGAKTKKSVEKKVPKKVNLTVKVETGQRKRIVKKIAVEEKPAVLFDKPEDIKKRKKEARKKVLGWGKKKPDYGFIRPDLENENKAKAEVKAPVVKTEMVSEQTFTPKALPAKILTQKTEADKRLIMWSGVGFFMLLIFVIWIFQIKYTISQASVAEDNSQNKNLGLMIDDVSDKIREMKEDMAAIKSFDEANAPVATSTKAGLPENIDMEKLIDDIASSTVATSSVMATGTEEVMEAEVLELKEKLEKGIRE